MKKLSIAIIVLAVLAGVAYFALRLRRAADYATTSATSTMPAQAVVKPDNKVIADAKVVPVRSVALSPPSGAAVSEVRVIEGDHVAAGDVLVRFNNAHQTAAVTQAEAAVRRAQARLDELKAGARPQEIEVAKAAYEATEAAVELATARQGPRSKEATLANAEWNRAKAQLELVQAATRPEVITGAEADVAAAEAELELARLALAETELRAPITGTVAEVDVKAGETVTAGSPIIRLADFSDWEIQTDNLTEQNVVRIQEGAPVSMSFDAIPGLKLGGAVARIKAIGERKDGDMTYTVFIKPAQQDTRFRWNMTASSEIQTK